MNTKIITFSNFPFGGASANLLRYFSLALAKESNHVEVILPTGGYYGNKIDIINKRKGKIDNVKFIHTGFVIHPKNYFGKFLDGFIGIFGMLIYLVKSQFKSRIDTIITYNPTLASALFLLFLRLFLRNKLIIILPEFYEKPKKNVLSIQSIKLYNYYWSMKYLIKFADGFIVTSHFLKNYIEKNLNSSKNILVLPNAMDPEIFNLGDIEPYKSDFITIGYTGTPTRKDGATDLIKSFSLLHKKYSNVHLLIIGDITNGDSILPGLKNLAHELGIIQSVTFTGLVPFSNIPKLLNSCQILALTRPNGSFAEAGFPTKLGEYFACRKPVVITRVGDISKYFENEEEVILVEPENIEDIAQGFEKLIISKELGKKICENAYLWMDKNVNYRKLSIKINVFVESI